MALYSLGLVHAILALVGRRTKFLEVALPAFTLATVLHGVSIVEHGIEAGRCPIGNVFETLSMCGFLLAVLFLFIYWRYRVEPLSVFVFPVVFMMALAAAMGHPAGATWGSRAVRNAWLTGHIVSILLGYAALVVTALAAGLYLLEERALKQHRPSRLYYRLPPLGTLDELISRSMAVGFVFMTIGVIAGSTWAFIELKTGWIGEPEVMVAFATWGIYMAMVFLRMMAGWRGRKAAILAVTALGCSAITWVAHARPEWWAGR